jgi:hypothetical protein
LTKSGSLSNAQAIEKYFILVVLRILFMSSGLRFPPTKITGMLSCSAIFAVFFNGSYFPLAKQDIGGILEIKI